MQERERERELVSILRYQKRQGTKKDEQLGVENLKSMACKIMSFKILNLSIGGNILLNILTGIKTSYNMINNRKLYKNVPEALWLILAKTSLNFWNGTNAWYWNANLWHWTIGIDIHKKHFAKNRTKLTTILRSKKNLLLVFLLVTRIFYVIHKYYIKYSTAVKKLIRNQVWLDGKPFEGEHRVQDPPKGIDASRGTVSQKLVQMSQVDAISKNKKEQKNKRTKQ